MVERTPELNLRAELFVLVLALFSVILLIYEVAAELAPHQQWVLERVDLAIALIFLAEFLWRFLKAPDRARFFRNSWWELLAAIPLTVETAQALRSVRLLRLVRVLRLLRVIRLAVRLKIVLDRARIFGKQTNLVEITSVVIAIVLTSAAAFHYFEFGRNPNVSSFGDSVWWAIITVTTVGYGDIYPITTAGRVVATILLVTGLGTFGTWAASMAAWIVKTQDDEEESREQHTAPEHR